MKKLFVMMMALMMSLTSFAVEIDTPADSTINLNEVTVSGLYRNTVNVGYLIPVKTLISENHGQEPSHLFANMPNIFSMNDNGTDFGYGYFRIRGLDQTRINVTLDGMPWNEAEDYGTYFANSPDIMSSLHSIKVERGTSYTIEEAIGELGIFVQGYKKDEKQLNYWLNFKPFENPKNGPQSFANSIHFGEVEHPEQSIYRSGMKTQQLQFEALEKAIIKFIVTLPEKEQSKIIKKINIRKAKINF